MAFIDEIFKANSAILNALLTILNERLFDNGSERGKVCAMLCTPCAPPSPVGPHTSQSQSHCQMLLCRSVVHAQGCMHQQNVVFIDS